MQKFLYPCKNVAWPGGDQTHDLLISSGTHIWLSHRGQQPVAVSNIARSVANSAAPDQMLHSVASDLGPHCLLRSVCPNTYGTCQKT